MKNKASIFLTALILIGLGVVFINGTADPEEKKDEREYVSNFEKDYNIYAIPLPDKMNFAGEEVPLDDFEVRERIDRELLVNTYWQSSTLLLFKNANRWFPQMEQILKDNGVPDDFKYLPLIESSLRHVRSPAGAAGYWQFLKGTGIEYGLEVNSYVDERYHPIKATKAACKYLKQSFEQFDNWTMAAASYNYGRGNLSKVAGKQKENNYYNLHLNEETARYVPRLLAIKEIIGSPEKYGMNFREADLYTAFNFKEISVSTSISDLADFAKKQGTTYKMLRTLNPWIRSYSIPNSKGKKYTFLLPSEEVKKEDAAKKKTHLVLHGERLDALANKYNVSPDSLRIWNELQNDSLTVGKELIIHP